MASSQKPEQIEDLLDHFYLETSFHDGCTVDTEYALNERVQRKWYRRPEPLGQGAYGKVWLEQSETNKEQRAVKVIEKGRMQLVTIDYKREILALAKFSKRQYQQQQVLVEFLGWAESPSDLYLFMEYFPLGDLGQHGRIPETETIDITVHLLNGLRIMHAENFAHRDLKPANIFVVRKPPVGRWWVKIGDFGISKRANVEETALHTEVGTPRYRAPEVTGDGDLEHATSIYDNAVDLWSLGCVIFKLISGFDAFPNRLAVRKFCAGRAAFPAAALHDRMSLAGIEFVKRLLSALPSERPSAEEALSMLWVRSRAASPDSTVHALLSPGAGHGGPPATAEQSSLKRGSAQPISSLLIQGQLTTDSDSSEDSLTAQTCRWGANGIHINKAGGHHELQKSFSRSLDLHNSTPVLSSTGNLLSATSSRQSLSIASAELPPRSSYPASSWEHSKVPWVSDALKILSGSEDSCISIIAIPGLNFMGYSDWEDPLAGVNWLCDMLPQDVPLARTYTYSWKVSAEETAVMDDVFVRKHAELLLDNVSNKLSHDPKPIIFVAHCLGGLMVAKTIALAAERRPQYAQVLEFTVGCIFLSTPFYSFNDSTYRQWAGYEQMLKEKHQLGSCSSQWRLSYFTLMENDLGPRRTAEEFVEAVRLSKHDMHITSFYERKSTMLYIDRPSENQTISRLLRMGRKGKRIPLTVHLVGVVDKGLPPAIGRRYSLNADHYNMCRFEGRGCENYQKVKNVIVDIILAVLGGSTPQLEAFRQLHPDRYRRASTTCESPEDVAAHLGIRLPADGRLVAVATRKFVASTPDEVSVSPSQELLVVRCAEAWFWCRALVDQEGWVPRQCVQIVNQT
ncbi:uncharacterized protein DSM5745_01556 [Aspergillus mulundensis]|uniref:Serine/threonine-protein kinase ATG1 n=1 Tax=Aspergillus mulundensis TaxID=1810919 RepID=A0A3D8T6U0_9EURO|nr:hypothetical protein DSM5745_01556 [Aspergillus mulundensis]RDW94234.1 hypothetical protein DSM5745_01556 [Aspergillus mulundensis]